MRNKIFPKARTITVIVTVMITKASVMIMKTAVEMVKSGQLADRPGVS